VKVREFETTTVGEMGFVEKEDVYVVLLDELKEFRASPSDPLGVPKENSGVNH
jgi:hypothetical protein